MENQDETLNQQFGVLKNMAEQASGIASGILGGTTAPKMGDVGKEAKSRASGLFGGVMDRATNYLRGKLEDAGVDVDALDGEVDDKDVIEGEVVAEEVVDGPDDGEVQVIRD